MLAHIGHLRDHFQRFVTHILRMRGSETDAYSRSSFGHRAEQHREGDDFTCRLLKTVGIDVLPQKCDFLVAFCHQVRHFVEDTFHVTAALASTGVGHDTVGTEIVTATHDRHESGDMIAADT